MNLRPSGYEPDELPGCSTPRGCWGREEREAGAVRRAGSPGCGAARPEPGLPGGGGAGVVIGLAATYSPAP